MFQTTFSVIPLPHALSCLQTGRKTRPLRDFCGDEPFIDHLFYPFRDGNGPNVAAFANRESREWGVGSGKAIERRAGVDQRAAGAWTAGGPISRNWAMASSSGVVQCRTRHCSFS